MEYEYSFKVKKFIHILSIVKIMVMNLLKKLINQELFIKILTKQWQELL